MKGVPEIKTDTMFAPAIADVLEEGTISLPNGCTLYWKTTEQGREYISDEVGGGVFVWHTALVDQSTLLAAIVQEQRFQKQEFEIIKRRGEDVTTKTFAVIDDRGDEWKTGDIAFSADTIEEVRSWAENQNYHSASIVLMDGDNRIMKVE